MRLPSPPAEGDRVALDVGRPPAVFTEIRAGIDACRSLALAGSAFNRSGALVRDAMSRLKRLLRLAYYATSVATTIRLVAKLVRRFRGRPASR